MTDVPLHFKTITEVAKLIESRELSPVELTRAILERIDALDERYKSYTTLMAEHAMDAARRAEREIASGAYKGPLHGVPVAVKDLCFTKGVRTMGGSKVNGDNVPTFDSTVVSRLASAGAVLLGKLNLTEGAMGGYNPDFDIPLNPWNPDRWAGSSSSGSGVATALGMCYGSLGSDTGGSIRFPAASCGTVGLKPTWGRVSRYGVLALAESLDHVGPLTRNSADAGVMLQAISGLDPSDPTSLSDPVPDMLADIDRGVAGVRIGLDRKYGTDGVDADLASAVLAGVSALEKLGAEIVEVQMPDVDRYLPAWPILCSAEAVAAHRGNYPERREDYGPVVPRVAGPGRQGERRRLRRSQQDEGGVQRARARGVSGHRRAGLPFDDRPGARCNPRGPVRSDGRPPGHSFPALHRSVRLQRDANAVGPVRPERRWATLESPIRWKAPE